MKITLNELRQFIKNVIKENLQMESNNNPMGGATDLFLANGYEIKKSSGTPTEGGVIELSKDANNVILKSSNISNTIQVNGGKVFKFSTITDRDFKIATMTLDLEFEGNN